MKPFLIFLLALIFRLLIFPSAFHDDIYSIAGWGQRLGEKGALTFYQENQWVYSWPTQPPLVNLVYGFCWHFYLFLLEAMRSLANTIVAYHLAPGKMVWFFNYLIWFDKAIHPVIPFPNGFVFSIKFLAIVSDLLLGWLIYYFAKSSRARHPLLWPSLYLFSPFSWYISALWGQYDQISYLFLLLSFILLLRYPSLAAIPLSISLGLKPTSAIFIPFSLWILWQKRPNLPRLFLGGLVALLFTFWTIRQFSHDNPVVFLQYVLIPKIIFKSEFRATNNSYNFWHIFTGDIGHNQNDIFFLFSYKIWGLVLFSFINFFAFRLNRRPTPKSLFTGLYLIGTGSWLFLTNMLERYQFAGVVSGLLLCLYYPSFLKFWLINSFLFFLNLHRGWYYPSWLHLKPFLSSGHLISGLWLSLINLFIFLKLFHRLRHER